MPIDDFLALIGRQCELARRFEPMSRGSEVVRTMVSAATNCPTISTLLESVERNRTKPLPPPINRRRLINL